ncbi:hypothetical protein MUO98_02085 [Candidatus Bathyarchaeota archaeon]|nr:hypothetical protein [Candidatus Bathyarchaeota archaeon]
MLSAKKVAGIVVLVMIATILLNSAGFVTAQDQSEPKTVKLQGYVSITWDANDVITSVSLITDDVTYNVVLNEKGLELGEEMADEEVKVEGVVSEKDEQQWITVRTFEAVEEE